MTTAHLTLGDITIDVTLKDVKNLNLRVYPPLGRVRISAPRRMRMETIRAFALSRLDWIRKHQRRLRAQQRPAPCAYVDGEALSVWGERHRLTVAERDEPAAVELEAGRMLLGVRPGADRARRRAVVEAWYRGEIKRAIPSLLARWQPPMGVEVERFYVRRMTSRWGSCNPVRRTIRLNTELARRSSECLEYVVVHELAHLIEPSHDARFVAVMDEFLPEWRLLRQELDRVPIGV